jgi:hypothetical protein
MTSITQFHFPDMYQIDQFVKLLVGYWPSRPKLFSKVFNSEQHSILPKLYDCFGASDETTIAAEGAGAGTRCAGMNPHPGAPPSPTANLIGTLGSQGHAVQQV